MGNNIHEGHRSRLKKELLANDFEGVPEHKLLEALLFYSIPRCDTNVTAHKLCREFGSLYRVTEADYDDLLNVEGVGEKTAFLIKLINSIEKSNQKSRGAVTKVIKGLTDAANILYPYFMGQKNEFVTVVYLDNASGILDVFKLCEGDVNTVALNKRRLAERAIRTNAVAVILAHNHPYGVPNPSSDDIKVTISLKSFLNNLGIELVDHIIFGESTYCSLRQSGQL